MDDNKRFVTGLDLGTENIRAVIATVEKDGGFTVVGYNEGKSAGMRKGIPANLTGPAEAIDKMLGDAERMGGVDVRNAYVSINGSTVISTRTEGMIAVGTTEHEINDDHEKSFEQEKLDEKSSIVLVDIEIKTVKLKNKIKSIIFLFLLSI